VVEGELAAKVPFLAWHIAVDNFGEDVPVGLQGHIFAWAVRGAHELVHADHGVDVEADFDGVNRNISFALG